MKKITMMIAMLAMIATAVTFSSCSEDDEPIVNNYTKYQNAVDAQVKANKKHNKAILLVAFGSTWQCAFDAFDATKKAYENEFKEYDVFVSYSSAICINRAAAGEHVADGAQVRNYYAPNFWLHAFGTAKYDEILVQSLQVIPGEEFNRVINYLKDFANNSLGDLDDEYLSKVELKLGAPLLTTNEGEGNDVELTAKALHAQYGAELEKGIVAFMGHGNPDSYDSYKANVRYEELEKALQDINPKYFVGTVDMPGNYKQNVWARIQEQEVSADHISLHALMSIAGDHAHNDMVGEGEDYWDEEDAESEDNSWLEYFKNIANYTVSGQDNPKGLLEVPGVLKIWMQHTREAVDGEALEDYYHSKFPEE